MSPKDSEGALTHRRGPGASTRPRKPSGYAWSGLARASLVEDTFIPEFFHRSRMDIVDGIILCRGLACALKAVEQHPGHFPVTAHTVSPAVTTQELSRRCSMSPGGIIALG